MGLSLSEYKDVIDLSPYPRPLTLKTESEKMEACDALLKFLLRERERAYAGQVTPNCKQQCSGCGANKLGGERSWCTRSCE